MVLLVWIANFFVVIILLVLFVMYAIMAGLALLLKSDDALHLSSKCAISIDQAANALLGGNEDHTMSGRMGYRIKTGKANGFEIWLCKQLSRADPYSDTHCVSSIEYDEVET